MKTLFSKRTILIAVVAALALAIALVLSLAAGIRQKDTDSYEAHVREAVLSIEEVSTELQGIDVDQDGKALLKAYDKIIDIANDALSLNPPEGKEEFDALFKAYMKGTQEGYTLIREGTAGGNVQKIADGIKILSALDSGFMAALDDPQ